MKAIKLSVLVFFVFAEPAFVFADQPRDEPAKQQSGSTEKRQGYAAVNGLKMYYEIHGSGKPLVVLHGAFGWATAYPALAKNRQLIAVELQGHGHTADIDRPAHSQRSARRVSGRRSLSALDQP
ncbi:MAG: hypothetical protein L0215_00195 [Gemmataceae bacterium]|nr:hypothetical protein [Gemmataceae bacterium]